MALYKGFERGASVYTCRSCGKRTRAVGDEINSVSGDSGLCADCWDLAGYDNARLDNCLDEPSFPYVVGIFNAVKGNGKPAAEYFPELAKAVGYKG